MVAVAIAAGRDVTVGVGTIYGPRIDILLVLGDVEAAEAEVNVYPGMGGKGGRAVVLTSRGGRGGSVFLDDE